MSAILLRLNPIIKGEDAGLVNFEFANGMLATQDKNRYNETNLKNASFGFGEMLIEGCKDSIHLPNNGNISIQNLGKSEKLHPYLSDRYSFCRGLCLHCISAFY